MKIIFIMFLFVIASDSFSQNKLVFFSSAPKLVNTLSFFNESKPATNLAAETAKIEANILEDKSKNIIYFDKNNQRTSSEKAFFFRIVKFNQNQIPIGLVKDFYSKSKTPKFSGNYFFYKNEDEENNNSYQGECTFYSENGQRTVNKYIEGKIIESKVYLLSGKLQKNEIYNSNKTRKSFEEYIFDKNENQVGFIKGQYNLLTKVENYKKTLFDIKGNIESITEYEGNCPKLRVTKYVTKDISYPAYVQDFTCRPNTSKDWAFQNSMNYTITHNESEKYFQVNSSVVSEGFLFTPILGDFSAKKFEISTVFQKSQNENIKEIGMVWQYQNENNYNYFVINLEKKTFEINSKINGESGRSMIGIKPQINIVDDQITYTLKLIADPINKKFSYFVNDKEIQGFNKIPVNPTISLKNWNIGFKFKAMKANESINLKKIEVKII